MKIDDMTSGMLVQVAYHATPERIAELTGGRVVTIYRPNAFDLQGPMLAIQIVIPREDTPNE